MTTLKFDHTVGSHSDDRGGDSDRRCTCQDEPLIPKAGAVMNPSNSSGDVELKESLIVTCCNCYNEKDIQLSSVGEGLKKFYNEHRTRIGRTYCKFEHLVVRRPFADTAYIQEVRAQAEHVAFEAVGLLNADYDLTVTGHQAHRNAVANLVFEKRCDWERFESKHPAPSNPEQPKEDSRE